MTREQLKAWLNDEVRKSSGCEECLVTGGLLPLAEPDESGCNWSDSLYLNAGDVSPALYRPVVREVLVRARSGINITCESSAAYRSVPLAMQHRELYTPVFHIDTNRINSRGNLPMMNQLEKWANDGVVLINMSGVSFREASDGADRLRTGKAQSYVFTLTDSDIETSSKLYRDIEKILFPNGAQTPSQQNDVKIVCDAAHWKAILVTADGNSKRQPVGILGNKARLSSIVKIMSDDEAVAFIRLKINERDEFNRRVSNETGQLLPKWTGKD